jgi:UDP-glucose 4-epimerase
MKNETVLIVGGAGYIGTHMIKTLIASGYQVIVLDDLSTGHEDLVTGGVFLKGSIADRNALTRIFTEHHVDAVMHFAAFSQVGESVENPLKYYRNNIAGTLQLVETMIEKNIRRFIFSSSASVYGEPSRVPITETHPCRPNSPYGQTKLAVEALLADCDRAYGLKSMCLRYFNAAGADESGRIGERHEPETHLIPLVLKTAAGVRDGVEIFGTDYPTADGTCIRDYVHVQDLADAHILALEALLRGNGSATYNLGNSKGYSVREVIETARRMTGCPINVTEGNRRPGDPATLVADSDKIRKELGWRPRLENLEAIIRTAWKWHLQEIRKDG